MILTFKNQSIRYPSQPDIPKPQNNQGYNYANNTLNSYYTYQNLPNSTMVNVYSKNQVIPLNTNNTNGLESFGRETRNETNQIFQAEVRDKPLPMEHTTLTQYQRNTVTLKSTGVFSPTKINPVSKYEFFLDNYYCYDGSVLLNNIPNCSILLKLYDLDIFIMYCVIVFFFIIIAMVGEIVCKQTCQIPFVDSKICLWFKGAIGCTCFIVFLAVPFLNILFTVYTGFFTLYYIVFLVGFYFRNQGKRNIFAKPIWVNESSALLNDFINEFYEINSQVEIFSFILFYFFLEHLSITTGMPSTICLFRVRD